MILSVFEKTLDELEGFTQDLEKEKSSQALIEIKSIWRIMKSIQMRHCPTLDSERTVRMDRIIERLEIKDVTTSTFSEKEAIMILSRFNDTCSFRHEDLNSEESE